MIINLEAEELLYRACFATESLRFSVTNLDNDLKANFPKGTTRKGALAFISDKEEKLGVSGVWQLSEYKEAEPIVNTLYVLKKKIKQLSSIGDVCFMLNDSVRSNFRYARAITQPYKADRPAKPINYPEAREYLLKYHSNSCLEAVGMEADDLLGIHQTTDSVCASIDKDLNMIGGKHLNWVTMERYKVPYGLGEYRQQGKKIKAHGLLQFYHQLLTGDVTDTILGVPGIGEVKAYNLLKDCVTEMEAFRVVLDKYDEVFGEESHARLKETASLIWICTDPDEIGEEYIERRFKL